MSAWGHSRQFGIGRESACLPISDMSRGCQIRRDVPITDICSAANCSLFDYLVGGGEQGRRHGEAQRLRGDEIDDKIELGWLLDRNVARLGAA
jgi:hypothetical protein